jgi:hypothetical protein
MILLQSRIWLDLINYGPFIAIALVIFLLLYFLLKQPLKEHGHFGHAFYTFTYSPQDFYKSVEANIKKYDVPGIKLSRVNYFEGSFIGGRREYLRIRRGAFVFDICASPFGTGFFVSWWHVEKLSLIKRLAEKYRILELFNLKTFYQRDTDAMYVEFFNKSFMDAVDEMTNAKGERALTELERQPKDLRK